MNAERTNPARRDRFASSRGLDRVVFFTDAISAIAITLLILPLVELVPESAASGTAPGEFLRENLDQVLSFIISFAVIARLWYSHHQIFEHVSRYSSPLALLSVVWAFTIVVLPLPTAITSEFPRSVFTVSFYIGTMMASSLTLTLIAILIRRDKAIEAPDNPLSGRSLVNSVTTTLLFGVALVIGVFFPIINYWALFVLVVAGPVAALIQKIAFPRAR
jgi:uncharacterized membrane protein